MECVPKAGLMWFTSILSLEPHLEHVALDRLITSLRPPLYQWLMLASHEHLRLHQRCCRPVRPFAHQSQRLADFGNGPFASLQVLMT